MANLTIEICKSRSEAEARKVIVRAANPSANWRSRIIENVNFVMAFLVTDISKDPDPQLPPVYSPQTPDPSAPCVVLLMWVEDTPELGDN